MAYNQQTGLAPGNRDVNDNLEISERDAQQTRTQAAAGDRDFGDMVDEWGRQSFPASDPPSNW